MARFVREREHRASKDEPIPLVRKDAYSLAAINRALTAAGRPPVGRNQLIRALADLGVVVAAPPPRTLPPQSAHHAGSEDRGLGRTLRRGDRSDVSGDGITAAGAARLHRNRQFRDGNALPSQRGRCRRSTVAASPRNRTTDD